MSKTNSGLFNTNPLSPIAKKAFIQELRNRGEKFNEEKIVFITKDATGQIIWLEKGNNLAGLEHIMQRHEKDFKKALYYFIIRSNPFVIRHDKNRRICL